MRRSCYCDWCRHKAIPRLHKLRSGIRGESPDPTEERIICELARAAGIAYARIDTAEHERTIAELRRNVTELERENNALGQLLHPSERPA